MPRATHWGIGLAASAALHAGAAGLYITTRDLDPAPQQTGAQSAVQLDTVTAPVQDAKPQIPQGDDAAEAIANSSPANAGAVPQSTAQSITPTAASTQALDPIATATPAFDPTVTATPALDASGTPAPALTDTGQTVAPATASSQALSTTSPQPTEILAVAAPIMTQTTATAPLATTIAASISPTTPVVAAQPMIAQAPAETPSGPSLASAAPQAKLATQAPAKGAQAAATAPNAQPIAEAPTNAPTARQPDLPATFAKADTAWAFGDRLVTDPTALTTIQAFMAPSQIDNADAVKDDLSDVLTGIDCARVSATFLPDTGSLEMRGHIPDPALRDTIVAAMQAQVGDGIPVTANLLHLPSPQCGALTGIANIGLPQSTDQFTDDRLIGQSAQAADYTYSEGQRLQFDLAAPDYDAFVYVDYFAADGTVIHLVPNETIALERLGAEELIGVGTDRPGKPSLRITIGPPFGQEIAVAFASSKPLYDGLRPIVEPAEPYLEYLKARVADARATDPDFKGEWVYFFITTQPRAQ